LAPHEPQETENNPGLDYHGSVFEEYPEDKLRIVGLNTDGLPISGGPKYDLLKEFMTKFQISILCLQELNNAWHMHPPEFRLQERIRGWFQSMFVKCAWYYKYKSDSIQVVGGAAIIVQGDAVGRVMSSGVDPLGLGRWVWVQFRGMAERSLVVVSVYRPVYNPAGPLSVWSQHKTYFDSLPVARVIDPRLAILVDLAANSSLFMPKTLK
jgi:hypothetical protein